MLNRGALRAQIPCGLVKNWMGSRRTYGGAAYFFGGFDGTNYLKTAEKLRLTENTVVSLGSFLELAKESCIGLNSNFKGYILGGVNSTGIQSDIDTIEFSNDTHEHKSTTLLSVRHDAGGVNSKLNGYAMGGQVGSSSFSTSIERINFSTEVISSLTAVLSLARAALAGVSEINAGYSAGGNNATTFFNKIDGLNFDTESAISTSQTIVSSRSLYKSASNSELNGYFAGGNYYFSTTTYYVEIDGINFSTVTTINPTASLSTPKSKIAGTSSEEKGIYAYGSNGSTYYKNTEFFMYDTETIVNGQAFLTNSSGREAVNSCIDVL